MAPCWSVLRELGYAVTIEHTASDELWIAQRGEVKLQASDPCALLGLAKLVEMRGESWRVSDEQIDQFLRQFYEV